MTKPSLFLLVITLAACCGSTLSAQTRFGLKAGFNMASMPLSDDYQAILELVEEIELGAELEFENKSLPAYHAGVVVEFGFGGNFGLGTGLQFSAKGGKHVFTGTVLNKPVTRTRNVMPMYLQLPLTLHFRSGGFYAGAGPFFGFAITGKTTTKIEYDGSSNKESEDLEFGDEEDKDFSHFDYGIGFELGYEFFGNLRLSGSYQLGLANIFPADEVELADDQGGDWSAKNNVIGVSLTYLFGSEE